MAKTVILSPSFSSPPSHCPITRPSLPPSLPRARAFFLLLPLSTEFLMSAQGNIVACLPTIGYMNMPGPPGDSGGTMICNGAVILTEDRIFMFGANSKKEASASDYITGTTYCTSICCCFPCCYGNRLPKPTSPLSFSLPKLPSPLPAPPPPPTPPSSSRSADTFLIVFAGFCGCFDACKVTKFNYKQCALRENENFQDSVKISAAKVSIKSTTMTQLTREYTVCL